MDASASNLGRLLVFALLAPLSILLGMMLTTPMSSTSLLGVGLIAGTLSLPILLRWHHAVLIAFWNAAMVIPFLPGHPPVWVVVACASLGIAVVTRTVRHERRFIWVPGVAIPLLVLAVVVTITLLARGGIAARALGSDMWGSKRYLTVLGAIVGYFALTAQVVPRAQAQLFASLFLLSGLTAIMSDLVFVGGPAFYFLYNFFSVDVAANQAMTADTLRRFTGLAWMAQAGYWFLLLRYGIGGMLNPYRPWRMGLFVALFLVGLFGGFRSSIILFGILFATQFWFEGLVRTRWLPVVLAGGLLVGAGLIGFADRLPLSVQRSLTFLPIKVHPLAERDAQGSLEWRLSMWRVVVHDVPQYLWLGKGYIFNSTDLFLVQESIRRGYYLQFEEPLVTGNYHNGLLTLVLPFGLPGTLAFGAFLIGAWRVLRRNYLHGLPQHKNINTFLIAYFTARLIFYALFYGQFDLDLMVFTGVVGLSIAINGGVCPEPQFTGRRPGGPVELTSAKTG